MARRQTLGDIVHMPLPTQYAPLSVPGNGVPASYSLMPGTGPNVSPAGGGAIAQNSPGGLPAGTVSSTGLIIPGTVSAAPTPGSPGYGGYGGNGAPGSGPFDIARYFRPDPILPDWMLPPALQRSNPLVRHDLWQPNRWDMKLVNEARYWAWIAKNGGLKTCCQIPELGAPIWSQPPWQVMPSQGIEYREMFAQPLSAFQDFSTGAFLGIDVRIGSFRVEQGFDGVLNQFVCGFTGQGFTDFSGSIVWRVQVDNRFAKTLGNVTNTYGGFQNAFLIPGYGVRLISGQTVTVWGNIPVDSPVTDGVVTAGLFGWTYPRR